MAQSDIPGVPLLPLRLNCGATDDLIDGDGRRWLADPGEGLGWRRDGGGATRREADLPLGHDLLRVECHGLERYRVALDDGHYRVRVVMGETFESLGCLDRRFELRVQGEVVAEAVNPFTIAGGFGRAGELVVDGVAVTTGELHLAFGKGALINGLEILPSEAVERRVTTAAWDPDPEAEAQSWERHDAARRLSILFVGNSGTFFWAIPESIADLIHRDGGDLAVAVDHVYHGGKGCEFFAQAETVRRKLGERAWDFVVVQDSSAGPIEKPDTFAAWMPQLLDLVRAHGATPILYAYHGPLRHSAEERATLMARYADLGQRQGVPVVPCAAALAAAITAFPHRNLHNPDRHHVGMWTGWLFTCCFYRALTGRGVETGDELRLLGGLLRHRDPSVAELVRIADETCAAWGAGDGILKVPARE